MNPDHIPILFLAVGGTLIVVAYVILASWAGDWFGNWWDNHNQPTRSTTTAVVPAPMAVVKPPPPAGRELRQTTAQLAQAERANHELTTAYALLVEENQRLRDQLTTRAVETWPTHTIEIHEDDLLDPLDWVRFEEVTATEWVEAWLEPAHV